MSGIRYNVIANDIQKPLETHRDIVTEQLAEKTAYDLSMKYGNNCIVTVFLGDEAIYGYRRGRRVSLDYLEELGRRVREQMRNETINP